MPSAGPRQGRSGLGLEAQQAAIAQFAKTYHYRIMQTFSEVETGKGADALERTREALAAAKARGQQLGDPEIGKRNRAAANAHAESLRAIVTPLAGQTTRAIAKELNDRGIKTVRGSQWQAPQVMRLLDRLAL